MADDDYTPWILETLQHAAEDWANQPEWTKPVVNAPYFAPRADMRSDDAR